MNIWLVLDLNPEPWAVGPLSVINRGGKRIPFMGRNVQLNAYKEAVAEQAMAKLGLGEGESFYFHGKTKLTIYLWRQRAEYETPQARTHRKHEADATNMLKATEDALQGIFYKNDKDNADVRCVIVEQGADVTPRIVINVTDADQNCWMEEFPYEIQAQVRGISDTQMEIFSQ